jgi:hypothetical protein
MTIMQELEKTLSGALKPFAARDEFMSDMAIDIDKGKQPVVTFRGTRQVAQVVASLQPDREVLDRKGVRVMPQTPPAPGFRNDRPLDFTP